MAENVKDRILRYLDNAYAVEEGAQTSLKDLADETTNPDVKAAVSEHIGITQSQSDRLLARITALGGSKPGGKGFLDSIITKGSGMLNAFHDKEDKETQDLIKAYSLEHFEVAMYTSLKAFADAVGDYETVQLAESIMSEEQLMAERLLRLIPQVAKSAVAATVNTGYPT